MNKEQKQAYLSAMVDYLKKCKAGYSTSPRVLFSLACHEGEDAISELDLITLSCDLYGYAKKEGLFLDCGFNNGEPVGLPQNISFSMYRKKPGARCPFCGSQDTAEILYGYPADFEAMSKEAEEHRLYIGGCMPMGPDRHCFHCEREFGHAMHPDNIASIRFGFSKMGKLSSEAFLTNKNGSCFVTGSDGTQIPLSKRRWSDMIRSLFSRSGIEDWEPDDSKSFITGGGAWTLVITFEDGNTLKREGSCVLSNADHFEELRRLFRPFLRKI